MLGLLHRAHHPRHRSRVRRTRVPPVTTSQAAVRWATSGTVEKAGSIPGREDPAGRIRWDLDRRRSSGCWEGVRDPDKRTSRSLKQIVYLGLGSGPV